MISQCSSFVAAHFSKVSDRLENLATDPILITIMSCTKHRILLGAKIFVLLASGLIVSILPLYADSSEPQGAETRSLVFASPELMSRYLAGEISTYRGALRDAFEHYWVVAQASRSPDVASRAARIALHLDLSESLPAVHLWTQLEPNAVDAWQALLLLYLKNGEIELAKSAAKSLMNAADLTGKDGYLEIAAAAAGSGDVDKAVALLESIAENNKPDAGSHYALGVALFGMQQYPRAETALRQALALKKDDARYWLLLSRVLTVQERHDEAEKVLSQAVTHKPDDHLLQLAYAESLVEHKKYQAAFEVFRNILQQQPDDSNLIQTLGALAVELKLWPEARLYWKQLLDDAEKRERANYFLGQVEFELGDIASASDYFNKVTGELQSDALVQLAKIEIQAGRLDAAHKLLSQQRMAEPDAAIALFLAEAELLHEADYIDEAISLLEEALQAFPDNEDIVYSIGMFSIARGDIESLELRMRQILRNNPDHAEALNALGYTLADETMRHEEALQLITRALEIKPESAAILDSMGWVLYRLGRYDESIEYLKRAAKMNQDGEIAAHLGEVLWKSGKRQQAIEVWKRGLEHEPDNVHIEEAMKRLKP